MGRISPLSSARGMKSIGGISPRSGCCQRISASSPTILARRELDLRLVVQHKLRASPAPAADPTCAARSRPRFSDARVCCARCLRNALPQPAQFQLAGHDIGQALQHAQLVHGHARAAAGSRRSSALPGSCRRPSAPARWRTKPPRAARIVIRPPAKFGCLEMSGNHHRAVFGQHHLEDDPLARQLPHRLAPVGLDPDAALVGKAQQHRVGLEVFGGQPRDGVEAGLRLRVQNPRRSQRSQPRFLSLPVDLARLQFRLSAFFSGPASCRLAALRATRHLSFGCFDLAGRRGDVAVIADGSRAKPLRARLQTDAFRFRTFLIGRASAT